jgi:hypothetical protein
MTLDDAHALHFQYLHPKQGKEKAGETVALALARL